MELTKYFWFCLTWSLIKAAPQCKYKADKQTELVCTSSEEDFILTRGLVSDNNRTSAVTLRGCRVSGVEYEAFENMASLKYIDLSQNNISELKLGVLDDIKTVTHLNLSRNSLSKFPLGLFDQLPDLSTLDLTNNLLENIELGVFDPLEKLKHLSLSNNLLRGDNINPYIFDRNFHLMYLDLSRNRLTSAPSHLLNALQVLETLVLDKCLLNDVPLFVMKNNLKSLKTLSLASNHVSKIDDPLMFLNVDNLEHLNLADNNIATIEGSVFKTLKKLKSITLRGNKLTALPAELFQDMKDLANIDLSHNTISTINVNSFRGTSVKNLNLANNKLTYLTSNFCLELRNSGAKLTKFYFNQNPWQCACLRDIVDEVKRLAIAYNSRQYDGSQPVCVTTEEFSCKRHDSFNSVYIKMFDNLVVNTQNL
ncbi:insulin-like growth factor-binding protein complex acid labile subunit [Danaus plexippus]|uniref:insulin-like growth factor-binding protein complex acid labile subunit n=1 Tax=Danaus plexippus TaxID=13037 RepID=UPI002AB0D267|nr:insulin-like growth factor-binding protein complex acid labile subunit [Danaus plexippus]